MAKEPLITSRYAPTIGAPLRSGVSDFYNLLVKTARYGVGQNTYELEDADHHIFTTNSDKECKPGDVVRCRVSIIIAGQFRHVNEIVIHKVPSKVKPKKEPKIKANPEDGALNNYEVIDNSPCLTHQKGRYKLRILLCMDGAGKCKTNYIYQLADKFQNVHYAVSNKKYELGIELVCHVRPVKGKITWHHVVMIDNDPSSYPVCLLGTQIVTRKQLLDREKNKQQSKQKKTTSGCENSRSTRAYRTSYSYNRKAVEIFENMKSYGYHKCGKQFTCSCCGLTFTAGNGYRADGVELYLCDSCKGGMSGRERKSQSVYAILTPMGGQNK